ncbi:MAG: VanW family protein [Coriobacteriia bacterium]|nr:VanW family protein [Coriobacteriia bacterium]
MKLSDKELLKRVLDDVRHDDVNEQLNQNAQGKKSAALKRKEMIQKEKAKKLRRKRFLRLAIPLTVLALLLGGVLAFEYLSSWGKIHRNVVVSNIEVGGKTPEDAQAYLDDRLASYAEIPIVITFEPDSEDDDVDAEESATEDSASTEASDENGEENPYSWALLPEDIELSFDTTKAVAQAYDFGRQGNIFDALQDRFMSYFEAHRFNLEFSTNEDLATETFEPIREMVNVEPVDSKVVREEDGFYIDVGSDGLVVDEQQLLALMADAVLAQDSDLLLPMEVYPRYIDNEEAQRVADIAKEATALSLDVNYDDQSWTFDSDALAGLLEFRRSDRIDEEDIVLSSAESISAAEHSLEILISTEEVSERIIGRLGADVGSSPRNAQFVVDGDDVSIRPSRIGSGVDAEQLALDLTEVLLNQDEDARTVEVTMRDIAPRRSTEDAEGMGIREQVGSFTTNFSLGNAPRLHNIQLMARMLDGILVAPGEEFSINGATGYRTAADGFQAAGVIVQGEMSTAVGGGICQVSTTMFNAAMKSGFQITQRINHSVFLSSYEPGRDAAIAAQGPDFRFRNTLDSYVLISTSSTNSSVTISFFGTDPGYDVDIRTGTFSRQNFSTSEVRDNTIPRGEREVERAGQRGGTVNVYYTVRDGDRIVREQTFTSNYRTVDAIVRVGTKPPASSND